MTRHSTVLAVAILVSLAVGAALPKLVDRFRAPAEDPGVKELAAPSGVVTLSNEQIEAEKIETAQVGPGVLTRRMTAPAAIKPDPDHVARVAAKVVGVVAQLRKKLGDPVKLDEVIAIVDSREVADAKSEYLAAQANFDLQSKLFQREKALFEKQITAEQLFLKAKTTFTEAKLRLDLARGKLAALDVSDREISGLATQPIAKLREKEIRAPISGRVIERLVNIGQPVTTDSQLYVLSDLSTVEADIAAPAADLGLLREGQAVRLQNAEGQGFEGKITYVNAMITRETRSGQVIASFPNPDFTLRPGSLLDAEISLKEKQAKIMIPRSATLLFEGKQSVFVRTATGFSLRAVELGGGDDSSVEVLSGLEPGETIATTNTFLLKAELGKSSIPEE